MLVPRSFLPRAAGLNQTLQGITAIVAAPLGALLAKRLKGAHLVRLVGGLLLVTSLAGLGSRFF